MGSQKEENDILVEFEKNYAEGQEWLNPHFDEIEANKTFAYEEQWDENERASREKDVQSKRPCLQFNKTLRLGKRLINDVEQMKLGIKVTPVDNGADPLIAEAINVVIKKIEKENKCQSIRNQSFDDAIFGNFGFYRIYDDWENERSFRKKIVVKRIVDNRAVLFQKSCIEPDLSDSEWFIIRERLPEALAKAKYPDVDFKVNYPADTGIIWDNGNGYCIAEMFCLKYKKATLVLLDDKTVLGSSLIDETGKQFWKSLSPGYENQAVFLDELDDTGRLLWENLPKTFQKQWSRQSHKKTWMWYKFAGRKVISTAEWKGLMAPVVFVKAREYWIKGKRNWMCLTTVLRDPQVLYNYYRSTQAERLTMAADAPWLLTAEHIAGFEDLWKTAHLKPLRYLLYNLRHNGEELPAPQRTPPIVGDPGLDVEVQRLDQEMLDIPGTNLASLGESSGERTGKAILVRQRQSEIINADYAGGYVESLYHEGKIILDLIPKVYTWDQIVEMLGEDKKSLAEAIQNKGLMGFGNGRYDLEIEIGSVSNTAREDEKAFWEAMIQANPQIAPLVMDKLVETVGNRHAKLLAKRFQAMMPPEVRNITEDGTGEFDEVAYEVNRVKQEMGQQMQAMQEQVQGALQQGEAAKQENVKLKSDMTLKQRELDLKELELALKADEIQIRAGEANAKIDLEYTKIRAQMASNRDRKPDNGGSGNKSGNVQA